MGKNGLKNEGKWGWGGQRGGHGGRFREAPLPSEPNEAEVGGWGEWEAGCLRNVEGDWNCQGLKEKDGGWRQKR